MRCAVLECANGDRVIPFREHERGRASGQIGERDVISYHFVIRRPCSLLLSLHEDSRTYDDMKTVILIMT